MNSTVTPASRWGQIPIPKNRESQSFKPCDLPVIREALKSHGVSSRSPVLPYWLSLEIIGPPGPAPDIADYFSVSPNDFLSFIPGTSEEQLVKVFYESASTLWFSELQTVVHRLTNQIFSAAGGIDYEEAHRHQLKQFDSIRRALLKGRARDVGVTRDLWKEDTAPVGRPETAKLQDISYEPLPAAGGFHEWAVTWGYRSARVPIGRFFIHGGNSALILDGRPYRYLGEPCQVGKKNILLVKLSRNLKSLVRQEVTAKFSNQLVAG
ncbi:MAG: hypothetical protein F6K11_00890 [Leptolyngbya sp. SIO3F4]|nr:hypothetical protein [Leptolyngbya sp. SIO3F4]